MKQSDRRSFLKMAGGIGVLYSAYPAVFAKGEAGDTTPSRDEDQKVGDA